MSTTRVLLALSVLLASGCDAGTLGPPDGGVYRFDGAMIPTLDVAVGRDTPSVPRDAGADAGPAFFARRPDVPYVVDVETGAEWIELESWNVLQNEVSGLEEMVVILRNRHTVPLCTILWDVYFEDAAGVALTTLRGTVESDSLTTAGGSAVACIQPGLTGIGYANQFQTTPLSDVRGLRVVYTAGAYPDAVPFAMVSRTSTEIYDAFGTGTYYRMRGHYEILSGTVVNPRVTIVPRDASGLPLGHTDDTVLGTFSSGWDFETSSVGFSFSAYYEAIHYSRPFPFVVDSTEGRAVHERWLEEDARRAEADTRRAVLQPR